MAVATFVFFLLSIALFFADTLWGFRLIVPLIVLVGTLIRISGNQILLDQSGDGVMSRIGATLQILTYLVRFMAMMTLTVILTALSAEFSLLALIVLALFGPLLLLIYRRWSNFPTYR